MLGKNKTKENSMNRFASRFALLALVGTVASVTPAFAAPPAGRVDCRDPVNAANAECLPGHGNRARGNQGGNNGQQGGTTTQGTTTQGTTTTTTTQQGGTNTPQGGTGGSQGGNHPPGNPPPPPPGNPPPPPGGNFPHPPGGNFPGNGHMGPPGGFPGGPGGHWSGGQRDQFRQFFRGFGFNFAVPFFDVRPGVTVPRSYHLRPVPPQIYRYYPYYRGYLYFMTRDGSIVIVSPRSLRIIDII
jgi:hypothetical protein